MEKMDLETIILFADEDILVVDKPAGIQVMPGGWDGEEKDLIDLLKQRFGHVWNVHRLDKGTSGVMVFALNPEAHRNLSVQFEQHEVSKVYHAIAAGSPGWMEKTCNLPLRLDAGHRHRTVVDATKGKPASTSFRLLNRFITACLLEAVPSTGRTHQIRAHAQSLGHPLLGDALYGSIQNDLIGRPALHAWSLAFRHPSGGEQRQYHAPYPEDFQLVLQQLME
jgi:RluA family pseudouridine synthase